MEDLAGPSLCGVAIELRKLGLELSRPHVVLIGGIWIGIDGITLGHGCPHLLMAHHHDIEHPSILECELILTQLPKTNLALMDHGACGGLKIPAEYLHER